MAAMRHSGGAVATLLVDRVTFTEPIQVGQLVEVRSRVVHVGTTSMVVRALVYAENVKTGDRRLTNECWLTFVHLDEDGRPKAVPGLQIADAEDRGLEREGQIRRERARAERGTP